MFNDRMPVELRQSEELFRLLENMQFASKNTALQEISQNSNVTRMLKSNEMCFYQVKQLSYDEEYPHREALENVLSLLDNEAFNFVYMLTGTKNGIELYVGVVKNFNTTNKNNLSASDYGKIVANAFEGNFNGSKLEKVQEPKLTQKFIKDIYNYNNAGVILGVPSVNKKQNGEEVDFQGVDRLINSMLGLNWQLVVICEPVNKNEISKVKDNIYELYNKLVVCSKKSVQISGSEGSTISLNTNESKTKGSNESWSHSKGTSKGRQSEHKSSSESTQDSHQYGTNSSESEGSSIGASKNVGTSLAVTVERANKYIVDLIKYIDEELLERFKLGFSKGLFKSTVYYMAEAPAHADRLKSIIVSLFQGNNSSYSPMYCCEFAKEVVKDLNGILCNYQSQDIKKYYSSNETCTLLSRPFDNDMIGLNTYLTTKELSLIAGLPQKEVLGIALKESVGFGLNEKDIDEKVAIDLGPIMQKGRELNRTFKISRDGLSKHTFIAGVTGSGKTTTCHKLLAEAKVPFLVIEPAKTEYRTLINSKEHNDVLVFTLGNETVAPFRINPFELIPGEVITAHVDMLKATFTAAYPMEAAMPQLLEEAIYNCYSKKGWDINTNKNSMFKEPFAVDEESFPIMVDLIVELENVVKKKKFGSQMESDYIGSLVSRLSNLTIGAKGQMLNCHRSVDFNFIAHNNVIIEMEELKSSEDKALLMGFILSRLAAVIKYEHKKDKDYKHLTLIEEAHRLLSKIEYGDNQTKKSAIETFTDLLAEVRKYGEGLIIVDQIPNKLTPEVLKNTNTKIIHKILAKDDKETVGDTMLMDDKQKEYLSALPTGQAIVFTEATDKPVHVSIKKITDTNEEQLDDEVVINQFQNNLHKIGSVYEDLLILPVYDNFCELCSYIADYQISVDKVSEVKDSILELATEVNVEVEYIWRLLIRRRDIKTKKAAFSGEDTDERRELLFNFFTNELGVQDITDERISDILNHLEP